MVYKATLDQIMEQANAIANQAEAISRPGIDWKPDELRAAVSRLRDNVATLSAWTGEA